MKVRILWMPEIDADASPRKYEVLVYKQLRNMLVHFTALRFPDLVSQAQKQAEQVKSQEQLRTMIDKVVTATTDQEARAALMS